MYFVSITGHKDNISSEKWKSFLEKKYPFTAGSGDATGIEKTAPAACKSREKALTLGKSFEN
ncbi:MAG: hypothetical protein ACI3Y1_02510, partial [Candidatus Cryptobacteroides sp.]